MTRDLLVSLSSYTGLVFAALLEVQLVGRLMSGRGRIVVLALFILLATPFLQYYFLSQNSRLCVGDICLHTLTRRVESMLNNIPWSPDWIANFTGAMLLNSALLLLGPVIVLACAQAARAFSDNSLNLASDRNDGLRRFLIGGGNKSLYNGLLWSAILFGELIITLAAYNPRGAIWRDLLDQFGNMIWSAPILAFGLLHAASRTVPIRNGPRVDRNSGMPGSEPRIEDLYRNYLETYQDTLLFTGALSPPSQADASIEADRTQIVGRVVSAAKSLGYSQLGEMQQYLNAALEKFWEEPEPGKQKSCPIFEESLTFLHFILFAELILSCQDRGGSTLIVAPQPSLRRIETELRRALAVHFAGNTQRIWAAGNQPPQGIYDVVLVATEPMEAHLLSKEDGSIVDFLDRLDLVIVLDYQIIDAALLRIRLARLRRLIHHRTVSVVCQSEPRAGLREKLANTISALVPVTPESLDIGGRGSTERYWLLWRNDKTTLDKILEAEQDFIRYARDPVEIVPMTLARAIDQQYPATFFDPYGRAHRAAWKDFVKSMRTSQRMQDFMEADWTLFPEQNDRVVAIEDLANLVAAARKNMNFMHHPDCLTHVVSHNYPMREFLRDVLQRETSGAGRRREGWSRIGEAYLPIAAHPTGGPIELAIDLATEFIRSERVTQHDVEAHFREVLRNDASEDSEISPTKRGLENLFTLQRGFRTEVDVEKIVGHEYAFSIKVQGRADLEPNFLLPVRTIAGQAAPIAYVDRQDEGLTYCRDTLLQIQGDFYRVLNIYPTDIAVSHAPLPTSYRPIYLFARQYVVLFQPRQMFIEERDVPAAAMGRPVYTLRLLLRGTYKRSTVAMATADEMTFDLVGGDGAWERTNVEDKRSTNASIMLVRFALSRNHPQAGSLDATAFSRLAFTLAATLQDTLRSFFPTLASSLAVMSPQAEPGIKSFLDDLDSKGIEPIDQLPFNLYPRLVADHFEPAEAASGSRSDAERRRFDDLARPAAPEHLVRGMIDDFIRRILVDADDATRIAAQIEDQLFTRDVNRIIDLIIVEDASHDRGAVRALFEEPNWPHVLTVWAEFVQWAARQKPDDPHFFYAFGRGRVPGVLTLDTAAAFLQTATRSRDGVRPARQDP